MSKLLPKDKEFTKLDCFIENEICSGDLKTRNIKFFLRYLKDNSETINEAFKQTTTPLPKKVDGSYTMNILSRLGSQKEAIISQLTKSNPTRESLSELLSHLDETLLDFSSNIIDPKNKQQCLFYTERTESYKKIIDRDNEKVWAEFIPSILTDTFRHCIMMVDQNKPCGLLYPYRNSNSEVTNSRESNRVVDAALEKVLKQIKSQETEKKCQTTYDSSTELTTEMKTFLGHASNIFNFMIDTFFDETQTSINGRSLRIDQNSENDEDLKFLAEFLFTCELPCDIDTNGKITYSLERGVMPDADYDFKKHRGKLFLYIIKLTRLLQQLLLSGLNPLNRLIFNLGEMSQVKNMFTNSFEDFKYFYDKKKKKITFVGQINISFIDHAEYIGSIPICYYVIEQSLDIEADLDSSIPLYFDFFTNNDSFFRTLSQFLEIPSFNKIFDNKEIITLLEKHVTNPATLNVDNSSSSDATSVSSSNSSLQISPEVCQKIKDLLINNEFIDGFYKLSSLLSDKCASIALYYRQIKAIIESNKDKPIEEVVYVNNQPIQKDGYSIDDAFHSCLSYPYTKSPDQHEKNFFDLFQSLMNHLTNEKTNKESDFVLIIDIESVNEFLQRFFTVEKSETYVISLVKNTNGSYSIYLGNNQVSYLPDLLAAIIEQYPELISELNNRNLFLVFTNVNVKFDQVPGKKEEYNKVGDTLDLITRFSTSVPYVKSVIDESRLINNMVTILVQNLENEKGKQTQDAAKEEARKTYNERINFFAKLLFIHFLSSPNISTIRVTESLHRACLFSGLFLIQNPYYFPQFEWEGYIKGNKTAEQRLDERIATSFEAHKTALYACFPLIKNKSAFDNFKEDYVNKFASKRLAAFIEGRKSSAIMHAKMHGLRRGGGRKTKKSTKTIKSNKSIKKMMKKKEQNQSRKRSTNSSNNKSKKLKQKNKK
jgi:hypothetical protein